MARNNVADERLRQRNKDAFQQAALYWNKLANNRVFEVSRQLLGIALIILPLSGSLVLADKIIGCFDKNMLVYGWFFLFISIISGFLHLWTEATYFQYLSNDSSTREKIWSDTNRQVKELDSDTMKLGNIRAQSSNVPLLIQIITLFVGIVFIMLVIGGMLFNSGHNIIYFKR